ETARSIRSDLAVIPQNRLPEASSAAPEVPAPDDLTASSWRIESQALPTPDPAPQRSPERSFNVVFDQAPIAAIADAVLGQTLRRSYRIDPAVQGSLTLSLTGQMSEAQALATLDRALRSVSAALVVEERGFAIVPASQAARLNAPPVAVRDGAEVL